MGFNVRRVRITVLLTYAVYDTPGTSETDITTGNLLKRFTQKEHHVEITVTNGTTGLYSAESSVTSGETIPSDLALGIWTALNRLQYEGEYVKVQSAINGGVSMLNRLNLSGGRADWATMNAQIQSIEKDYGRGETQVTIGPAKHLNAQQLLDIFHAWRFRLISYNPAVRASGDPGGSSGATEISKNAPKKNTMEGLENPSAQVVAYHDSDLPTGSLKGQCIIDAKTINDLLLATTPTPAPTFGVTDIQTIQVREIAGCNASGQVVYMLALVSAPYTKP
jgi:hypothetical protein